MIKIILPVVLFVAGILAGLFVYTVTDYEAHFAHYYWLIGLFTGFLMTITME